MVSIIIYLSLEHFISINQYYLLEIEVAAKSLLTHGASVWLLLVVRVHMKCQVVHLQKVTMTKINKILNHRFSTKVCLF